MLMTEQHCNWGHWNSNSSVSIEPKDFVKECATCDAVVARSLERNNDIQTTQRQILSNALHTQRFADVTFIIGKQQTQYNINRIFLAMISPVFEAMLYGKMRESEPNSEVIIEETEPDIFECVINFGYFNDPMITSEKLFLLIRFCDKYQITSLLDICYNYLRSNLNENNFCSYCHEAIYLKIFRGKCFEILNDYFIGNWNTCLNKDNFWQFFNEMFELNMSDYINKCKTFLQKSSFEVIEALLNHDAFLELKLKIIQWILQIQPLQCSEESLWESVLKWADHQSKKPLSNSSDDFKDERETEGKTQQTSTEYRLYLLKSVRCLIRFGLMNGNYFAKFVEPENVLSEKELLRVLLYYQEPERGCGGFETSFRMLETIKYTLGHSSMSWGYTKSSKYEHMIDEDLDNCMVTQGGNTQWIEAQFDNLTTISKISIGSTYYPTELSGKRVQIQSVNGKWKDVLDLPKFAEREIREFYLDIPRKCTAIRVYSDEGNLNIGHLKVFGAYSESAIGSEK